MPNQLQSKSDLGQSLWGETNDHPSISKADQLATRHRPAPSKPVVPKLLYRNKLRTDMDNLERADL